MPVPERSNARAAYSSLNEDQLFQKGVVRVTVDVSPEYRHTPQGHMILRGYIGGKEIEVVFPGARRSAAYQLAQRLRRSADQAKAATREASAKPFELRQKITVDGVWRVRLLAETQGMPQRRFQLVAARWRYRGPDGVVHVDGSVPYG